MSAYDMTSGTRARLLVVEDEPTIRAAVVARMRAEGFAVEEAGDGPSAVETASRTRPDLVILDVMLPGFDGLEVCRRVQAERPVPVLMLTARDDETDKLIGLGVGADDYLTKPFSPRELVARVKALLRRVERASQLSAPEADTAPLVLGEITVLASAHRVYRGRSELHLTPTEFDLLMCLAARPGAVLTREQLLEQVWDWADAAGTRTVDTHIKTLRRKVGADLIRTVHGVGYALEVRPSDD